MTAMNFVSQNLEMGEITLLLVSLWSYFLPLSQELFSSTFFFKLWTHGRSHMLESNTGALRKNRLCKFTAKALKNSGDTINWH